MKITVKPLVCAALAAAFASAPLAAQAQFGGPPSGASGERRGARRNNPKARLTRLVGGMGALERGKKTPLSAAQAKRVALAINPWRSRKTMTEDQAKALYMNLNGVLTSTQKNELDRDAAKNRRFGGERPRGERGGFGGQGAPSAADMQKMRAQMQSMQGFMKTMNPFYAPTKYSEFKSAPERMREGMTRRYNRQNAMLAAIARKGGVKW